MAVANGMPESFVNKFKRDYVSRMDLVDARTVMAQTAAAFGGQVGGRGILNRNTDKPLVR
ncbi:hypothetical protein QFZ42_001886 [Variovorax paradoxus]|uniref:hypothetical protein n=1 Tax=Variovorax paradoxus TaxID=34073 RepID=UPI002790E7A8|nr:hypothetical protein [Variovorax paradoxus]MDQ0570052.1 hypothetical protein [Variovorax paradoxus]